MAGEASRACLMRGRPAQADSTPVAGLPPPSAKTPPPTWRVAASFTHAIPQRAQGTLRLNRGRRWQDSHTLVSCDMFLLMSERHASLKPWSRFSLGNGREMISATSSRLLKRYPASPINFRKSGRRLYMQTPTPDAWASTTERGQPTASSSSLAGQISHSAFLYSAGISVGWTIP
jgi:hypothetical protein